MTPIKMWHLGFLGTSLDFLCPVSLSLFQFTILAVNTLLPLLYYQFILLSRISYFRIQTCLSETLLLPLKTVSWRGPSQWHPFSLSHKSSKPMSSLIHLLCSLKPIILSQPLPSDIHSCRPTCLIPSPISLVLTSHKHFHSLSFLCLFWVLLSPHEASETPQSPGFLPNPRRAALRWAVLLDSCPPLVPWALVCSEAQPWLSSEWFHSVMQLKAIICIDLFQNSLLLFNYD